MQVWGGSVFKTYALDTVWKVHKAIQQPDVLGLVQAEGPSSLGIRQMQGRTEEAGHCAVKFA